MSFINIDKLDNPVWHSLSESHKEFAIEYEGVKFYNPEYCPFGGFDSLYKSEDVDDYAELVDNFFIVGEKPSFSDNLKLKAEVVCLQMIIDKPVVGEITNEIVPLTSKYTDALYELVNLVQPGYFKKKTALLGNYFGIFENNDLVAVTGERMKMNDFVEISAVVTHPDHGGKGYAKQLVTHVANTVFSQDKVPYLHVVNSNIGAIKLYEKLGFSTRREISFWNITK